MEMYNKSRKIRLRFNDECYLNKKNLKTTNRLKQLPLTNEQRSCRIENGNLNYSFEHNLTIDRIFSSFFVQ